MSERINTILSKINIDHPHWMDELRGHITALQAENAEQAERILELTGFVVAQFNELLALRDVDAMVSRFLCWKLPKDFAPDGRIKFDREFLVFDGFDGAKTADISEMPAHFWPTGTNLFTAEQAKAMIEHLLGIEHE